MVVTFAFCSPLLTCGFRSRRFPATSVRRPFFPRACAQKPAFVPSDDLPNLKSDTRPRVRVSSADDAVAKDAARRVWSSLKMHPSMVAEDEKEWGADDSVAVAWVDSLPIAAGRLTSNSGNARLERVFVLPDWRGQGVGRALVQGLMGIASRASGAVYVKAQPAEMGFYSLMGFEAQGPEVDFGRRVMVLRVPECAPGGAGCIGLHHTSVRVRDIERSLAFYGCIGFFVTDKFITAGGARACFIEGLGTRLELIENTQKGGGDSYPAAGFDRLVFDVTRACTDLDTYVAHLRRRNGGTLSVRGPTATQVVGKYVVSVATVEDVDGLPIEFIRREANVPVSLRTRVNW